MGSSSKGQENLTLDPWRLTLSWDGKFDTGAYVDNGTYIIRVCAEGADGMGLATDEAVVEVKTPFQLSNVKVDPADKKFSTLGGIDRITVSYNISKDSLVTAIVHNQNGDYVATLANGEEVIGANNPSYPRSFVWRGNYPDADSSTIVSGNL